MPLSALSGHEPSSLKVFVFRCSLEGCGGQSGGTLESVWKLPRRLCFLVWFIYAVPWGLLCWGSPLSCVSPMTSESFISHAGLLRAPRAQAADGALLSPLSPQTVKALADDLCCPPLWGALSPKLIIYELLTLLNKWVTLHYGSPLRGLGGFWWECWSPLGMGACWIGHLDRVHLRVQNLSVGDPSLRVPACLHISV